VTRGILRFLKVLQGAADSVCVQVHALHPRVLRPSIVTTAIGIVCVILCICMSGCRNPVTIEATLLSPSGGWVAELIAHDDVAGLVGEEGVRGFLVSVRKPEEARDPAAQMVLHALGRTVPTMKWVSEQALDVHLPPSVEVTTQRKVPGVTVNVR
jgi:hypothetical protein